MATSTAAKCTKCNAYANLVDDGSSGVNKLYSFGECGHVMCEGCIRVIGIDARALSDTIPTSGQIDGETYPDKLPDRRGIPIKNADCPVCQRQALLPNSGSDDDQFPPYLKKFSIVKKAIEQQVPKLCDNCTGLAATPSSHCLDCEKYLCDECFEAHGVGREFKHRLFKLEELKRGSLFKAFDMKLISLNDPTICKRHDGVSLTTWCYTCNEALCFHCKRHHLNDRTTPIENHLQEVGDAIKESRADADKQCAELLECENLHKSKQVSVESLCNNVKAAILEVAERKKKTIEEDAVKLVQDVDRFMDDFQTTSWMLAEMTKCEKTTFDIWEKIYNTMSTETGDVVDEFLLEFHEFLRANQNVTEGQSEVVKQISEGVESLLQQFIEFKEDEQEADNQVGTISQHGTITSQATAADSGSKLSDESCSSRPASASFDDVDQGLFTIADTELWKSQPIDKGPSCFMYKGVYKTEGTNLPVAIKELQEDATKEELDCFINEAEKLRDLDHGNIVKFIGVCRSHTLLLVLDLARLGPLGKYLKSHPLTPLIDLYELLHQVSFAMKYLEEHMLVHRCLTARTIYLDAPRHAKIGSFGMAKYLNREEGYFKEKAIRRFPLKWYPPEAIYKFKFDAKCDVWSFGVVMWEVFSYGAKPYQNMKGPEILTMLDIGERLVRPDRCPRPTYTLMRQCWETRANDRPTFDAIERNIKEMLQNEISSKSQEDYVDMEAENKLQ